MNIYPLGCEAAARHALALTDDCASGESIAEAMAWADAEPGNRRRLDEAMQFLCACDRVRVVLPDEELQSVRQFRAMGLRWTGAMTALAASVLMLMSGVVLIATGYVPAPFHQREHIAVRNFASNVGEIRTVRLSERNSATLAGDTEINVSYGKQVRRISLVKGQALFRLNAPEGNSIAVNAGPAALEATTAEIDVERGEAGSTVTVVEGAVLMNAASTEDGIPLGKGMQLTAYNDGTFSAPSQVNPDTVTSWYRGVIQFAGARLSRVVEQLNRYSSVAIVLATPDLGEERVSGMVEIDKAEEWLAGLARTLDIDIVRVRNGPVVLRRQQPSVRRTKSLENGAAPLV